MVVLLEVVTASSNKVQRTPLAALVIATGLQVSVIWSWWHLWTWSSYIRQPRRLEIVQSWPVFPAYSGFAVTVSAIALGIWTSFGAGLSSGAVYGLFVVLTLLIGLVGLIGFVLGITTFLWGKPKFAIPPELRQCSGILARRHPGHPG